MAARESAQGSPSAPGTSARAARSIDLAGDVDASHPGALAGALGEGRAAALDATLAARVLERDGVWRRAKGLDAGARRIDAFLGRNSAWPLHPDDLAPDQARRDAPAAGREVSSEGRHRTRADHYRPLGRTAVPFEAHICGVAREAALRDSQDVVRLTPQSVGGVGVWTYEVATDRFSCDGAISGPLRASRSCSITGYAEQAAVGNCHLEPRMAVPAEPSAMDDLLRKIHGIMAT